MYYELPRWKRAFVIAFAVAMPFLGSCSHIPF